MKLRALLVVCALLALAAGCKTESSSDAPPTVVVNGAPSGAFVVGDTLNIQVDASDPEGGTLEFDWDYKPKDVEWTAPDRAEFLTFENSAIFNWDPLASDALNGVPIELIFIVTDQAGNAAEKVVPVNIVAGNGQPDFRGTDASELYDPRSGKPLEFDVSVVDQDSEMVELAMPESPGGAQFEQNGPYSGHFTWMPTVDQLERRSHTVLFTANDGDNPEVEFTVTIVVRTASAVVVDKDQTMQMCPGEAVISHTPLGAQRDATSPYRFEATLLDERFDSVILYLSTSHPYNGDDMQSDDEERAGDSLEMTNEGGTWVAEVQPYTGFVPAGGALTVFYQFCAIDEDGGGADSVVCAPSSGELELWHTFTVYAPDSADCVEDGLDDVVGNDDFDTAAPINERWEPFRVCQDNPDFYSINLREGESALFSAVYNDGANISFEAFDGEQNPIELKTSDCTGLVTAEVSVPDGAGQQTYYLKATGSNANYMMRAFKSGNAAECADSAQGPNDSAANATPIADGETVSAAICPDGNDLDVFSIDLQAGDVITATNTFVNAEGNLDMTLFGPGDEIDKGGLGTGAYTAGFEDEESFSYTVEETGTHYILVFNNNQDATTYDLKVELSEAPPCPDDDEYTSASPNHTQAESALLPAMDDLTASGLAVCPGKPDWYRRTEFAGTLILGEVTVSGGDGTIDDVTVQVFDEDMNVVGAGARVQDRLDFDFSPGSNGIYYFKIETENRVEYQLSLLR